jgi:hypothetical protein
MNHDVQGGLGTRCAIIVCERALDVAIARATPGIAPRSFASNAIEERSAYLTSKRANSANKPSSLRRRDATPKAGGAARDFA